MFNSLQRPLGVVPRHIYLAVCLALFLQLIWSGHHSSKAYKRVPLSPPPSESLVNLLSLNETILSARLIVLWLQAFDNPAGVSIPLQALDYDRVAEWLELALMLDPHSSLPLLVASRIYAAVPDLQKKSQMIAFVHRHFLLLPAERWQWMAHVVLMAKHQLKDLHYALLLARDLREQTKPSEAPDWARQMEVFILEDLGEIESARILIGGLLESGALNNPRELKFLSERMLDSNEH